MTYNQTQKEWIKVGRIFKRMRIRAGMSIEDLAQKEKVDTKIIERLENGDIEAIKQAVIEEVKAIIESAEVRPTDLLNIKNKKLAEETNEKLMPMLKKTLLTNLNNKE